MGWWAASSAHVSAVAPASKPDLEAPPTLPAGLDRAAIAERRAATIRTIFGADQLPGGMPAAVVAVEPPLPGATQALQLTIPTAAGPSHPLLLRAGHGRLAIYHAGHEQDPIRDARQPIEALLAAGYDVLAIAMPAEPHARMAALDRPLEPFLEPVAVALNFALAGGQYRDVVMMGLSGGGWTTVVYSAIDPRVRRSYPVAGSLPLRLRSERDVGDFEQTLPGLSVGYLELYLMASTDGREQLQVSNRLDPCCFAGSRALSYAGPVADQAQALGGRFGVLVVEHNRHEVPGALLMLVRGL